MYGGIKVENKSRFITPGVMLFAGAVSMIIMMIRRYDLFKMLWILLVVLIVFYIIGDIARYIYNTIRPRIIPASLDLDTIAQQVEKRLEGNHDVVYLDEDPTSVGSSEMINRVDDETESEDETSYLDDALEEEYSDESLSES